jgi:peptidoglycan/xylan/chitin deacetylase (PgdA/CDA1 family)
VLFPFNSLSFLSSKSTHEYVMLLILAYHELCPSNTSPWSISPDELRHQLTSLVKHGFRFATLDEVTSEQTPVTPESKVCVVTFDDGRHGAFRYGAEILKQFNCTGTFFICPDFIDGHQVAESEQYSSFMSWDEIRALAAAGHTIGSHAMTHKRLSTLTADMRRFELGESKRRLEQELGTYCSHFAAPHGDLTSDTVQIARELGYKSVASIISGDEPIVCRDGVVPRFQVERGQSIVKALSLASPSYGPHVRVGEYICRLATPADSEGMNRLFNRVFGLERSIEEFNWKFKGATWAQELPIDAVLCEKDGELVGMYPMIMAKWLHHGETLLSVQPVDNCIAQDHRGKGIQKALFSIGRSEVAAGLHFGFGFPGGYAKEVGQGALGYRRLADFHSLVLSLESSRSLVSSGSYHTRYISSFDSDHDAWWRAQGVQLFSIVIPRIASYLNWRYVEHPRKKFRIIQILGSGEDTAILGYAVLGFSFQAGMIQAVIYDFVCGFDQECVHTLVHACAQAAREAYAQEMIFPCISHNPYIVHFESIGFKHRRESEIIFVVGSWHDETLEARCLRRPEDWFVSFGDSDL